MRFSAHFMVCVLLAGTASLLIGAYILQYGFGFLPCQLCLWQRVPHWLALALFALAWGALRFFAQPALARYVLLLAVAVLMVSAGLGAYHAGIEWKLWAGPASCGIGADVPQDFTAFLQSQGTARFVSCLDAPFRVLGLSLAGWNAVASMALLGLSVIAHQKIQVSSSVSQ